MCGCMVVCMLDCWLVCMYVCMHVGMQVCFYTCVCVYVVLPGSPLYLIGCLCDYVCVFCTGCPHLIMHVCNCDNQWVNVCVHGCVFVFVYVSLLVCMCVCIIYYCVCDCVLYAFV